MNQASVALVQSLGNKCQIRRQDGLFQRFYVFTLPAVIRNLRCWPESNPASLLASSPKNVIKALQKELAFLRKQRAKIRLNGPKRIGLDIWNTIDWRWRAAVVRACQSTYPASASRQGTNSLLNGVAQGAAGTSAS